MRASLAIVFCALIAGCADSKPYYGNVYEGLKTRDALLHPSVGQKPAAKSMSYQEYEAERKRLLESDDKK